MASDPRESPRPRVERFFDALLDRDGAGGSWLGPLLRAAPRGAARFGELAQSPGWLEVPLAVRTETGRRGAFEYPAAPSRQLLGWFIDHPDELVWAGEHSTPETLRLRRALIDDDPPGVRVRAQGRAHDLLRRSTPLGHAWWRFEEPHTVDCLLMTDRIVLVTHASGACADTPATPWFPRRSALVRDLEAARRFADGGKAWGVLVLDDTDTADADDGPHAVATAVLDGAPHLDEAGRRELADGYLGTLSWSAAARAARLQSA